MIAGGIVLYNPDIDILKENIKSIYPQVDTLIIVDNNSIETKNVSEFIENYENITFIKNNINVGIAKALNQIMEYAYMMNNEWVITLDQDTVCPSNIIEIYKKYIDLPKIAVITPRIIDRNDIHITYKDSLDYEKIDRFITSASMNNTSVWKKVGRFDERMFIDFVDFEYAYRIIEYGYKAIRVNKVKVLHRLGDLQIKHIGKKKIHVGNHNPSRKYYYSRNAYYCHKKHRQLYSIKIFVMDIGKMIVKTLLYEKSRRYKLKNIILGLRDGILMKID